MLTYAEHSITVIKVMIISQSTAPTATWQHYALHDRTLMHNWYWLHSSRHLDNHVDNTSDLSHMHSIHTNAGQLQSQVSWKIGGLPNGALKWRPTNSQIASEASIHWARIDNTLDSPQMQCSYNYWSTTIKDLVQDWRALEWSTQLKSNRFTNHKRSTMYAEFNTLVGSLNEHSQHDLPIKTKN